MVRVVVALCVLCATAWAQPKPTGVVTKAPKLIQAQAPEYPPAALAANKQAKVKVRIHIDETGIVTSVDVVEPVGDGFDEAAVDAAKQYIFEPAEIDGKPGKITVETTINFVIEQQAAPEPPPPPPPTHDSAHQGPPNHAGAMTSPVTLSGVVVERGTRKKLGGVIVSIAELGLDVVTGEDGSFFFHGVAPGAYKLLAVDDKYDRFSRQIILSKREALEVRLWLRPRGGNPYETVLEGEKESFEVTKRTLTREQLTSVPGTFGDPIRVIQTLPGVARAPFGLGLLLIRGSNPNDSGHLRRRPRGAGAVPLPRRPVDLQRADAGFADAVSRRLSRSLRSVRRRRRRARDAPDTDRRHPRRGEGRFSRRRRLRARADHE